jgi:hypothetical protein
VGDRIVSAESEGFGCLAKDRHGQESSQKSAHQADKAHRSVTPIKLNTEANEAANSQKTFATESYTQPAISGNCLSNPSAKARDEAGQKPAQ